MKTVWKHPLFWFILASIVRLLYLQEQSGHFLFHQQMLDEREIAETARNGFPPGEPYFKAPLYVWFIQATMFVSGDAWVWLARLIQHLCGAGLVVIAFDAARRISKSPPAAAIIAGILCFYGPLIRLEDRLILDFFTVFFQSAMLWAMLRIPDEPQKKMKWAATASLFAALSWLNRPTLMPVLPILAMWIFMHRRPWKPNLKLAIAFLILPILAIGGFALRNHVVSGEALTTPWQGGYNFLMANKPGVNGRYFVQEQMAASHAGNPSKELMLNVGPPYARNRSKLLGNGYEGVNSYWFDKGSDAVKSDIPAWMGLMVKKGFYLVTAREIYNFEDYRVMRDLSTILKITFFNFGWLWPLAFASLAFWKSWTHQHVLAAIYLLFLGGAIALFFTSGRLRMPLFFPVVLLASVTIAQLIRNPKQIMVWVLIAAGIALSWIDWWGVRSENLRDIEYARLSNAAWRARENEVALSYADQAVDLETQNPQIHQLRGQALHSLNRFEEAVEAYKRSTLMLPNDPNAFYNLGIIYHRNLGDTKNAYLVFEGAAERGMTDGMVMIARLISQHNDEANPRPYREVVASPGYAKQILQQAIAAGGTTPRTVAITAICIAAKQGDRAAIELMSKQLEADFGQAAMDELAWELEKVGYRP